MKNHIDNLVSTFKEKSKSLYEKLGGEQKGVHTYSLTPSQYKVVYNKLQKKKIYKDQDGDVFVFMDGLIVEKTRPAICIPRNMMEKLMDSDQADKFVSLSAAAQVTSFLCDSNPYSSEFQDMLSQNKTTIHHLFKEVKVIRLDKDNEMTEPLNVLMFTPSDYIKDHKENGGVVLPLVSTQILQRSAPYYFHSSFGMIHFSEFTEEMAYNITKDEDSFKSLQHMISRTAYLDEFLSSQGMKKIEIGFNAVIGIENGKVLESLLEGEVDINQEFNEYQNS